MTKNNTSSTKISAETKAITATSTGMSGVFLAISTVLPEHQRIIMILTPFASTFISFMGLILYCKFIEPPEFVAYRSGLKRDLKALRKILKDNNVSEVTKKKAQKNYDETSLELANLYKNNSSIDLYSKKLSNNKDN